MMDLGVGMEIPTHLKNSLWSHMYGGRLAIGASGNREVIDEGFDALNALAKTGQGKKGDGLSVHASTGVVIDVTKEFSVLWEQEAGLNGVYLNGSAIGAGKAQFGMNSVSKLNVGFSTGVSNLIEHGLVAGQIGSFGVSWDGISPNAIVYVNGLKIATIPHTPYVNTAVCVLLARDGFGSIDSFVSGVEKDFYYLPESMNAAQHINHFNNPEFTLFRNSAGNLASANGISRATLDKLEAGVDSVWYSCGETLNATSPNGSIGYLINNAVPLVPVLANILSGQLSDSLNNSVIDDLEDQSCTFTLNAVEANNKPLANFLYTHHIAGDIYLFEFEITSTNPIEILHIGASTPWWGTGIIVDGTTTIRFISGFDDTGANNLYISFVGDVIAVPTTVKVKMVSCEKVSAVVIENFTADVALDAQRVEFGTQQCVQKIGKFGEVLGLADTHEINGNCSGLIELGYGIANEDFELHLMIDYQDPDSLYRGYVGNNSVVGTEDFYIVSSNDSGATTIPIKLGDKYVNIDDVPHGKSVMSLRYNSVTQTAKSYRNGVLSTEQSGVLFTGSQNLYLLSRSALSPDGCKDVVGSFTFNYGLSTDEQFNNTVALIKARHKIT